MTCDGNKSIVRDIYCSTVAMAGIFGSIAIVTLQFGYVIGGSEHRCDHRQVWLQSFHLKRIDEVEADGVEQLLSLRHEIRHGVGEVVNYIER